MRDSMHNRVQADVFVPAGGRPATINAGNWEQYLSAPGGGASAPLVVEGANLFTTPAARQSLHDAAGVVFVKVRGPRSRFWVATPCCLRGGADPRSVPGPHRTPARTSAG